MHNNRSYIYKIIPLISCAPTLTLTLWGADTAIIKDTIQTSMTTQCACSDKPQKS